MSLCVSGGEARPSRLSVFVFKLQLYTRGRAPKTTIGGKFFRENFRRVRCYNARTSGLAPRPDRIRWVWRYGMPTPPPHQLTQLLIAWSDGSPEALDELFPLVYAELRQQRQVSLPEPLSRARSRVSRSRPHG